MRKSSEIYSEITTESAGKTIPGIWYNEKLANLKTELSLAVKEKIALACTEAGIKPIVVCLSYKPKKATSPLVKFFFKKSGKASACIFLVKLAADKTISESSADHSVVSFEEFNNAVGSVVADHLAGKIVAPAPKVKAVKASKASANPLAGIDPAVLAIITALLQKK